LGPFGLLFVLLADPVKPNPDISQSPVPLSHFPFSLADTISLDHETKKCPHCAETIKFEAIKCRYCLETLNPETVASEVAARRAELEEDYRRLSEGKLRCPICGLWDVLPYAVLPDGGHGPWCPHCKKPVPK
jgi:transposase-like protein